jgi:hypothetical protein
MLPEIPEASFTETALSLPQNMGEEQWTALGGKLATIESACAWWVGDWILYGEQQYGKRKAYALAQAATRKSRDTLYQYARVAERFKSCTRVQDLPFSHHRAVERLPESDRALLLEEARAKGYTVEELTQRARLYEQRRTKQVTISFFNNEVARLNTLFADAPCSIDELLKAILSNWLAEHAPAMFPRVESFSKVADSMAAHAGSVARGPNA